MVAHPDRRAAQTLGQAVGRGASRLEGALLGRSLVLPVAPPPCGFMHMHVSEAFGPDPEGD